MYKTNISMYIATVVLFPTEYIMLLFEKENDLKEIRTIVLDFFSSRPWQEVPRSSLMNDKRIQQK